MYKKGLIDIVECRREAERDLAAERIKAPPATRDDLAYRKLVVLRQLDDGLPHEVSEKASDETIRGIAELVCDGLILFNEACGTFAITGLGRLALSEMSRIMARNK